VHCPKLHDLPPPPPGNTGWPWTEEYIYNDQVHFGGWPKISIVTASYNRAKFIEETIRAVLLQGYPNLEYVIIDGASTDGSIEIIGRYRPWITHFISEPDGGEYEAVNMIGRTCIAC